MYTLSVAYAPLNSEELAMAYGNRSALLLHLRKHKECLRDVELALKITQSESLRAKMLIRKGKCLKAIDNSKVKEIFSEAKEAIAFLDGKSIELKETLNSSLKKALTKKPQFPINMMERVVRDLPELQESAEVPSISKKVVLKYEKKIGRFLEAKADIKTGEILVIEPGYAQCPTLYQMMMACSNCLTYTWNGIPCDGCAMAIYCSEECKAEAWTKFHDMECSKVDFLLTTKYEGEFETFMLMVRTLIRAYKSKTKEDFADYLADAFKAAED